MRTRHALAAVAFPLVLGFGHPPVGHGVAAPGAVTVRVNATDTSRHVVVRVEARGRLFEIASAGTLAVRDGSMRVTTPAVLTLSDEPGRLALISEAATELRVELLPGTGATSSALRGTGRTITIARQERAGSVHVSAAKLEVRDPR